MSETVDTKIVELQFNNKQFEKNVSASLSTIDKLKKALNFDTVTTGINLFQNHLNNIKLDKLGASLDSIGSHFTIMGRTIDRIVDSTVDNIISGFTGGINTVVSKIKEGGINRAMNIERSKFSLQGLGIDWDKVKDPISASVNDTAYGLDQAAIAASNLMSSGVGLDVWGNDILDSSRKITKLEMSLKGVAGVAGQTGKDYSQVAHVFSTVAGQGRLMGQQLSQLSVYGINAADDIAKAMGKTETAVRDMISKGKISAEEFFEVMYEKYWPNAGKANDTVEGITANIQAALSKIGEAFYHPILENEGPWVSFLNTIKDTIDIIRGKLGFLDSDNPGKLVKKTVPAIIKYLDQIQTYIENFNILRLWRVVYRIINGLVDTIKGLIAILIVLKESFKAVFPKSILNMLLRMAKGFTSVTKAFKRFAEDLYIYGNDVTSSYSAIKQTLVDVFKALKRGIWYIKEFSKQFIGGIIDGIKTLDLNPLELLAKVLNWIADIFKDVAREALKSNTVFDRTKQIIIIIGGILRGLLKVLGAFGKAISEVFKASNFKPLTFLRDLLQTLTKGLVIDTEKSEQLKNAFKNLLVPISFLVTILGTVIKILAQVINWGLRILLNVIVPALSFTGSLGEKIAELAAKIRDFGKNALDTIIKKFQSWRDDLKTLSLDKFEHLKDLFDKIKDAVSPVVDKIKEFGDFVKTTFTKAKDAVVDFISSINIPDDIFTKAISGLDSAVGTIQNTWSRFFSNAPEDTKSLANDIEDLGDKAKKSFSFSSILEKVADIFERISKLPVIDSILSYFQDFIDGAGKTFEDISNTTDPMEAFEKILEFIFSNLSDAVDLGIDIFNRLSDAFGKFIGENPNFGAMLDTFKTVFLTLTAYNWSKAAKNFTDAIDELTVGVQASFEAFTNEGSLASTIKAFGTSMLLIAVALAIVAKIPLPELVKAGITIAIFLAAITAVTHIISKSSKDMGSGGVYAVWDKENGALEKTISPAQQMVGIIKALGKAMIQLAIAMLIISLIPKDKFEQGMKGLALIFALLAVLMIIIFGGLTYINKSLSKNDSQASAQMTFIEQIMPVLEKIITSIGKAMLKLAIAMLIISTVPVKKMSSAILGMAVLGIILGAILEITFGMLKMVLKSASTGSIKGPQQQKLVEHVLPQVAIIISAIGKAMLLMGISLKLIGSLPIDKMWSGVGVMAALALIMVGVIGGLVFIMSKLSGSGTIDPTVLYGVAAAIVAVSVSFSILSGALIAMSLIPIKLLGKGLLIFAGALGILLAAGAVATLIAPGLIALGASIALIGVGVGVCAMGIAALVAAFGGLMKLGIGVVVLFKTLGSAIGGFIMSLVKALDISVLVDIVVQFIADFLTRILNTITKFATKILGAIVQLLATLVSHIDAILEQLGILITKFLTWVSENIQSWVTSFINILVTVVNTIVSLADIWGPALISLLGTILDFLISAVTELGSKIIDLIISYIQVLIDGVTEIVPKLVTLVTTLIDELTNSVVDIVDSIVNFITSLIDEITKSVEDIGGSLTDLIVALINTISTGITSIVDALILALVDILEDLSKKAHQLSDALSDLLSSIIAEVVLLLPKTLKKAWDKIVEEFENYFGIDSPSKKFAEEGAYMIAGLAKGLVDKSVIGKAVDGVGSIINGAFEGGKGIITSAAALGGKIGERLGEGIDGAQKTISKTMSDVGDWIGEGASDIADDAVELGKNIADGIGNGIESASNAVNGTVEKAGDMAKGIGKAVVDFFDISSPSRLMAKYGGYIATGLANGINQNAEDAIGAMSDITSQLAKPIRDTAMNMAEMINEGIDTTPTITPVLDLSSVRSSAGQLSSMFGTRSLGIARNLRGVDTMVNTAVQNRSTTRLENAISKLSNDIQPSVNNNYTVNGVTYDDGSNISSAVRTLIDATNVQRRM